MKTVHLGKSTTILLVVVTSILAVAMIMTRARAEDSHVPAVPQQRIHHLPEQARPMQVGAATGDVLIPPEPLMNGDYRAWKRSLENGATRPSPHDLEPAYEIRELVR